MEENRVVTVKIRKVNGRYGVTIESGEGILVDDAYYQPGTTAEVGKLVEMWLDGLEL